MTTHIQPRTVCTIHGVAHREATRAAIACAALTAATAGTDAAQVAPNDLVTVTAEQLRTVLTGDLHLVRQVVQTSTGTRHVVLVNAGLFGEHIADAVDVDGMLDYYGTLDVAADMLTAELRLEQAAGITHIDQVGALAVAS